MRKEIIEANKEYVYKRVLERPNKILVYIEYVKKECGDNVNDELIFGQWGLVDRLYLYQDMYSDTVARQQRYIMGEMDDNEIKNFNFDNAQKHAYSLISQMEQIVQQFVLIYKKENN